MADTLTQLALVVAAVFTGAAVYVNAVEHPARCRLDPRATFQEWQPAYQRGAATQATLALVGFVLAALAALPGAGTLVGASAAFIIAPWPWTYPAIMPLNKRLLAMTPDEAGSDLSYSRGLSGPNAADPEHPGAAGTPPSPNPSAGGEADAAFGNSRERFDC